MLPWFGGQKEEEKKDGQKQHGVELLKRKEMERGGLCGREPDKQPKIGSSGKKMSRPYAPHGPERIKNLNYCPDDGNGDVQCHFLFCEAQQSCSAHQNYIL